MRTAFIHRKFALRGLRSLKDSPAQQGKLICEFFVALA
jgi:hypothetical protein